MAEEQQFRLQITTRYGIFERVGSIGEMFDEIQSVRKHAHIFKIELDVYMEAAR